MSEKKDLYRLEEERTLEQVASFFEKVADNLRNGQITFEDGTEIELPDNVTLDIDVDERDKENVIATTAEFELKWTIKK
ncbi:MAG: amphi-Trp domain-containing protein [Bacteroidetes bacterium]|nr:amphi-Trp domain-containing protein [Bacteroidota bacterium]